MAYNTKYRVTFKDFNDTTIQADIQQDGWSVGNVTDLTPTSDPLIIEWPGERDNIFNPVRGAVATLNFYATEAGQFEEFFDANAKEYMLVVSKGGSVYWRGWLSLEDYQESLQAPPYTVSVVAYDLGYLKNETWDTQYHADDTILDVIFRIIGYTDIDIGLIERVNIYEDTLTSASASDDMLDSINLHPTQFMDDSWDSVSMYEALQMILRPFNAFIMQENDNWNICRVADMRVQHWQRTYAYPQLLSSSGNEDTRQDLSSYYEMDRSAILMACPNYRKLNVTYNQGNKNIVNNGNAVGRDYDPTYYWDVNSGSATLSYTSSQTSPFPTATFSRNDSLKMARNGSATRCVIEHEKTYEIETSTVFDVSYGYAAHQWTASNPTCTLVTISVELDTGATTYYLDWSDGSWSGSSSASDISFTSTGNKYWTTGGVTTDETPAAGTLTIKLTDANWSNSMAGNTFFMLNITPYIIDDRSGIIVQDLSETIDSGSLEDSPEITFHFGDPYDADSRDILFGGLTIASTGDETDTWQSKAGSVEDTLLNLAVDCYKVQYETAARRLQGTIKGTLDYLTVLQDASERCFLASSLTRDFRKSEMRGEWIEIKVGWDDELTGHSWTNGSYGSTLYDSFSSLGDQISVTKSQTSTVATCELSGVSLTAGVRYLLTLIVSEGDGDPPDEVNLGGTAITGFTEGTNEIEFVAASTSSTHIPAVEHAVADTCTSQNIEMRIQEVIGA